MFSYYYDKNQPYSFCCLTRSDGASNLFQCVSSFTLCYAHKQSQSQSHCL